jgi:LPPG:FO 2-phospho-L-lactate transferase
VVALSGGVGGAKLVQGLSQVLGAGELTVIVNTGDDFEHLGLHVAPDIDSVVYALAGLSDPVRGWGRRDETWTFMAALKALGGEDWFALGDTDLAMHVRRSHALAGGASLSTVTTDICRSLGVATTVLPMSDDPVRTRLLTAEGWLEFQDYFVRRQCAPAITQMEFAGAATARALPAALAALAHPALRAIIICPSNPFVSVAPILAVPGIRAAIRDSGAPVIAVTPIIGGKAIKGPAAKMLAELGFPVSAAGVAGCYAGLVDAFISDETDPEPAPIAGMSLVRAPTLMRNDQDRRILAQAVLDIAARLPERAPGAARG